MGDLILKMRLEMLKTSLQQVEGVLLSVEQRRSDRQQVLDIESIAAGVAKKIKRLQSMAADAFKDGDYSEVGPAIDSIGNALTPLSSAITRWEEAASTRVQPKSADIDAFRISLDDLLVKRAKDQLTSLKQLQDRLSPNGPKSDGQPDLTGTEVGDVWQAFSDTVSKSSQKVFTEYVDFLGGLLLRDSGFDEGICLTADELLRSYHPAPEFQWRSLTIPARQEALNRTLARIIRMGFPEWTLWALPLTAHELGHVVVAPKEEDLGNPDETSAMTRAHQEQIYMADAFATGAMGLAYACAAILLRLDPLGPDPRHTLIRAAIVFEMLQRMEADIVDPPFRAIRKRLETEWSDAIRQVKLDPELTVEEQSEVTRIADLMVDQVGPFVSFQRDAWGRIVLFADSLQSKAADIPLKTTDEPRYVLNAAWKRRMEHPEEDPGTIATNAEGLLVRIRDAKVRPEPGQLNERTVISQPASPQGAGFAPKMGVTR